METKIIDGKKYRLVSRGEHGSQWTPVGEEKTCPLDGAEYEDFCMAYDCEYNKGGICEHEEAEG